MSVKDSIMTIDRQIILGINRKYDNGKLDLLRRPLLPCRTFSHTLRQTPPCSVACHQAGKARKLWSCHVPAAGKAAATADFWPVNFQAQIASGVFGTCNKIEIDKEVARTGMNLKVGAWSPWTHQRIFAGE